MQVGVRNVFPVMSSTVSLALGLLLTAFDKAWTLDIALSYDRWYILSSRAFNASQPAISLSDSVNDCHNAYEEATLHHCPMHYLTELQPPHSQDNQLYLGQMFPLQELLILAYFHLSEIRHSEPSTQC